MLKGINLSKRLIIGLSISISFLFLIMILILNKLDIINVSKTIADPLFILISGAIGAVIGYLIKAGLDVWTEKIKWRQSLADHIRDQIEKMAPSYYLMLNYSYLLSNSLEQYIEIKRQLQMLPIESGSFSPYDLLNERAKSVAKSALFFAGKHYRVVTDLFWKDGGTYFVPDLWARDAIVNLHNEIMELLHFDSNILLKYIEKDTLDYQFYDKIDAAMRDDKSELRDELNKYHNWILSEDKEVKKLLANARAYSNLFSQQMDRLYEDYFKRGWLEKSPNDPRDAHEIKAPSLKLYKLTQDIIKKSAEKSERKKHAIDDMFYELQREEIVAAKSHLNLGWIYNASGKHDNAILEYSKALEMTPDDPVIWNNLGNVYVNKEEYEKAAEKYTMARYMLAEKGTSDDPAIIAIYAANKGWMEHKRKNFMAAAELYKEAAKIDPLNSNYYNNSGNAYFEFENWTEAKHAYYQAIAISPLDPVLYGNLAGAYAKLNKSENFAIENYEIAIDLAKDPQKANYYFKIGDIYKKIGKFREAAYAYEKALDIDEQNDDAAISLIASLKQTEENIPKEIFNKAVNAIQKEIKKDPNVAANYFNLASIYFDMKDYERALNEADKAIRLDQKKASYWNLIGLAYRRLNRFEMVIRSYDKAIEINPDVGTYYANKGLALYHMDRYDEAIKPLEIARSKDHENVDILLSLAEVYIKNSKPDAEKAMKACDDALRQKNVPPYAYSLKGDIQCMQGDYSNALDSYLEAITNTYDEKDKIPLLKKMHSALKKATDKEPEGIKNYLTFEAALDFVPNYVMRLDELEINNSEMIEKYEQASKRHQNDLINFLLGNAYFRERKYNDAIDEWKTAVAIGGDLVPYHSQININLGLAYNFIENEKKALESIEKAVLLDPDNFIVRFRAGMAYYWGNHIRRSLSELQDAFRLNTNLYILPYVIGNCYYKMQIMDLAEDKWMEAISIHPAFAEAYYSLGVMYYNQNKKDLALDNWQKAIFYNEKFIEAHFNLAILNFERNNKEIAEMHWQKAKEINLGYKSENQDLEEFKQNISSDILINGIKELFPNPYSSREGKEGRAESPNG